jgi:hypothetical protein
VNIDALHEQLSAEFGGPALGALPAFRGDVIRPHKGGSSTSTTQSVPDELKPLASAFGTKAMDLANQGYQGYNGQQVADPNWYQKQGADMIGYRAANGNPLMNQAQGSMQAGLASGDMATKNSYSGSNPYLQQNIDATLGDITRNYNDAIAPGITTQAVSSGSFGNTGAEATKQNSMNDLTKNLGNTASSMRMQDYTAQQGLAESYANRNDQMKSQAYSLAPTYGNQAYTDASQMMKVGQQYQDNTQQNLDAQHQSYLDEQNLPYKQLAAMSGVFGSGVGQTQAGKTSGGGK